MQQSSLDISFSALLVNACEYVSLIIDTFESMAKLIEKQ